MINRECAARRAAFVLAASAGRPSAFQAGRQAPGASSLRTTASRRAAGRRRDRARGIVLYLLFFLYVGTLRPQYIWAANKVDGHTPNSEPSQEQVMALLTENLGPGPKLLASGKAFILGDFMGDGSQELAALVILSAGRKELLQNNIHILNTIPGSEMNGTEIKINETGNQHAVVAILPWTRILHGSKERRDLYVFFTSARDLELVRRNQSIWNSISLSQPELRPNADLLLVGGTDVYVYWNGKTYKGNVAGLATVE